MADVSFRNVSKRYGEIVALDSLDLDIGSGEFVSLLGPSGSGKSTTLNLLSGLQDADGGTIHIGGRDVTHLSPDKRDLALVFQNYALYPHLTIRENLAFPLDARRPKVPAKTIDAKVTATAALLGIGELLDRYPKEISGGQQQRVALGRAMVRDPEVFLLDEPLSNLDARLRIRMRRDLKALHAKLKSTVVYVTHDQSEAMTMSDRIAVFSGGKLQQFASPHEIYNCPVNAFVANFVGDHETNFLDGTLIAEGGRLTFHGNGFAIALSRDVGAVAPAARVRLGVRPESISVVSTVRNDTIPARVLLTELAGPDLFVFASLADGSEVGCRCDPNTPVNDGEQVNLLFAEEGAHLFDAESGLSISHGTPRSNQSINRDQR